ncbi:hypothetical protein AMTRI_Chr08g205530 [Amborella trichopoda]
MPGCVTLNIDGCFKGNPGRSGFGGILMHLFMVSNVSLKKASLMFGLNVILLVLLWPQDPGCDLGVFKADGKM